VCFASVGKRDPRWCNVPDEYRLRIEFLVSCCLICQGDQLAGPCFRRRYIGLVEVIFDDVDGRHVPGFDGIR